VAAESPVDDVQWRLAEAAYLLRVANLRARMEGDRQGAEALLRAADELLAELDDYGLFPVREAIAAALAALRAAPAVDRVGLYLEIESLGERIDGLPVDTREYAAGDVAPGAAPAPPTPTPAPEADGAADRVDGLIARFTSLVDFRRNRAEPVRPLLAPQETAFLRHNLALKLEQAQLALLEGDQAVWEDALTESRRWIATWFEAGDADVVALGEALDRLVLEQVAVSPPDISAPLTELRRLRGRGLDAAGEGSGP
jgi:uroporphyrin-3 C-methyltransferase